MSYHSATNWNASFLKDPTDMDTAEKDSFLDNFYSVYIRWLVQPFNCPPSSIPIEQSIYKESKMHACEIITFCIRYHGYRAKYYIFKGGISSRIMDTLYDSEKHLVLGKNFYGRILIFTFF